MCLDNIKPFMGKEPKYVYKMLTPYSIKRIGQEKYHTPYAKQKIKIGKWNRGSKLRSLVINGYTRNRTHTGNICVYKNLKDAKECSANWNSIFKCEVDKVMYTGTFMGFDCYIVKRIKPIKEVN